MIKSISYYLATYIHYDTKYFLLSTTNKEKINEYHDKIARQHDIAERISIIIAGHLMINNRADLLHDNETLRLANNAIGSLYLINDILTHKSEDLADLFLWMGQQNEYETYTVPGYNGDILYEDHINPNLISALIISDNTHILNFFKSKHNNKKHAFAPYPNIYSTYEIVTLAQLSQEQIGHEIRQMVFGINYDWLLYTRNINYIISCVVKACQF